MGDTLPLVPAITGQFETDRHCFTDFWGKASELFGHLPVKPRRTHLRIRLFCRFDGIIGL